MLVSLRLNIKKTQSNSEYQVMVIAGRCNNIEIKKKNHINVHKINGSNLRRNGVDRNERTVQYFVY